MPLRPPRLIRRVIALFKWGARDTEMDQEMAFHIEAITRDYMRAGMSEAEAARAARKRFGNVLRLKEAGHDVRTAHLDRVRARHELGTSPAHERPHASPSSPSSRSRSASAPTPRSSACLKSVLLDALPYADADRLVRVYARWLDGSMERGPLSAGTVADIAARQRSFESLAAFMRHRHRCRLRRRVGFADHAPGLGRAELLRHARRHRAARGRLLTP